MADSFVSELCERVSAAAAGGERLVVRGGGTKDFYGGVPAGAPVDMRACTGIVAYEPRELVLTVRAGTPLAEVEAALAAERQMLPFEPPHYGAGATIGGTVAAGFSGPYCHVSAMSPVGPATPNKTTLPRAASSASSCERRTGGPEDLVILALPSLSSVSPR